MTEERCRFNGANQPRIIPGRHTDTCTDSCTGCQPCERSHCRVCGVSHDAGACPECMAETREALREIGRMCGSLPEEVEHRGVEGEAMFLLAPAANPEARGHLEASVLAGRVSRDAIEITHKRECRDPKCVGCAGELHPEFVLGAWDSVWREALDHDEPVGRFNLAATIDYLDRTMTYMATYPHVAFEEFAGNVRQCAAHLEAVLHDEERGVRANVPCFDCGADLERRLGAAGFEDHWTCRGCKRRYTIAEYNFALRAELEGRSA